MLYVRFTKIINTKWKCFPFQAYGKSKPDNGRPILQASLVHVESNEDVMNCYERADHPDLMLYQGIPIDLFPIATIKVVVNIFPESHRKLNALFSRTFKINHGLTSKTLKLWIGLAACLFQKNCAKQSSETKRPPRWLKDYPAD